MNKLSTRNFLLLSGEEKMNSALSALIVDGNVKMISMIAEIIKSKTKILSNVRMAL
jgi:hypothetical protein